MQIEGYDFMEFYAFKSEYQQESNSQGRGVEQESTDIHS